ncbi:MAG: energy-coupling factor transporter transmembrane protein EcfT [Turicibacter sp.]|nr:energy-coupling factor transporter transmembrane protein EcfT [Turicibacter sp.]
MVKNLSIGRYMETNSVIHHLDPRTKLISVIGFVVILLMASSWQHYVALTAYTFLIIFLTRIPLTIFLKGIRPLLRIILFTAFLQALFSGGGTVFWSWGPFTVSEFGLRGAGVVVMRFSLIIMMTSTVGLSTKPMDLTDGVERLLTPLKWFDFAVQDLAFMMSIALRFIPTLFDEGHRLMKAQESRGVQFNEGNFFQRMRKLLPLFIPIFMGSFNRAQELANALDVRGYVSTAKRTKFRVTRFNVTDLVAVSSLGVLALIYVMF